MNTTGSIAFGVNSAGESARAGGWGYLLGDSGSAYEIGRRALAAVGAAHDGTGPATALTTLVLQTLGTADAELITRAVYEDASPPKLRIAGYREGLRTRFPAARVLAPEFPPLAGALLLALKGGRVAISAEVRNRISERLG